MEPFLLLPAARRCLHCQGAGLDTPAPSVLRFRFHPEPPSLPPWRFFGARGAFLCLAAIPGFAGSSVTSVRASGIAPGSPHNRVPVDWTLWLW